MSGFDAFRRKYTIFVDFNKKRRKLTPFVENTRFSSIFTKYVDFQRFLLKSTKSVCFRRKASKKLTVQRYMGLSRETGLLGPESIEYSPTSAKLAVVFKPESGGKNSSVAITKTNDVSTDELSPDLSRP